MTKEAHPSDLFITVNVGSSSDQEMQLVSGLFELCNHFGQRGIVQADAIERCLEFIKSRVSADSDAILLGSGNP